MSLREAFSFCRICYGKCGMRLLVDDEQNRIVDARGDQSHAMTSGYACIKGLQSPAIHHGPNRLLHPLKRQVDGTFAKIPLEQALDEIAERIRQITERHGADALGTFHGTQHYANSTASWVLPAFVQAANTRSCYSTMTIDQSAKWVAELRMGAWAAGRHRFLESDVWMFVGYNPLVSVQPTYGFLALNPTIRMKDAKARGMKFIVIDPRRTETAHFADVHLQPYPGEDPTVMAGLLRIILAESWQDREFCTQFVNGVEDLRRAVEPFTPDYVARRAGVPADQLYAAAKLFASTSKSGAAVSGTGPDMAPRSNLAEHLIEALNVVCGRYLRAGGRVANPGAMSPRRPVRAEVIAPTRSWENGYKSRVRGLGMMYGQKMSGALADEILTPGEGQLRCLIVDGANPANALPDRPKAVKALSSLDLLVTIEPFMTETAQLAHYILPPIMMFERPDMPLFFEKTAYPEPFAQYSPAIIKPPAGSELVDDWYVFWGLAKRLGLQLEVAGQPLDMRTAPSSEELLAIIVRDAQVPLEEIKKYPSGKSFELEPLYAEPPQAKRAGNRFEVMPPDVAAELKEVAAESAPDHGLLRDGRHFRFRLSVRRSRHVINTTYRDVPEIRKRMPFNPLNMHPDDIAAVGIEAGAHVEIVSLHGRIRACVKADDSMRPGVVSMCHGWGSLPMDQESYELHGASTNDLIPSTTEYAEPINGMPWYSALPVDVIPLGKS